MNDFATNEFINKNIRVRPPSGTTAVDKDEMKSDILGKGNILGGGNDANQMDDEEKYNQIVNIEMEQQRKKIKADRQEMERIKL